MLKIVTRRLAKIFGIFGYDVIKKQNQFAIKPYDNWLERLGIETIVDVGANEGQFALSIDEILPGKKIIAFEPIKECYEKLVVNTKGLNLTAFNCGLSDHAGRSEINISQNLMSSSILPIEKLTTDLYPDARYVNKQSIELRKLDDVTIDLQLYNNILLKIDVQGYESAVISGATDTINGTKAVIIECSYRPLYEGQWLFDETYQFFTNAGFRFMGVIDQARSHETSIPIYGDAIFVRKELCTKLF